MPSNDTTTDEQAADEEREWHAARYARIDSALGYAAHVASEVEQVQYATVEADGLTWHLFAVNTSHNAVTMQKIVDRVAGRWSGVDGRDEEMRHVQVFPLTE